MQNRMLDAADILIHRHPVIHARIDHFRRAGARIRKKYHDESTNVSIVSVSRRARAPHCGHTQSIKAADFASGLPEPSGTRSSGRRTAISERGTGTTPHASQGVSGIGVPQYRCLEMPQSRSRQRVHGSPKPRAFKSAPTALIASAEDRPSYFPLWIQRPDSAYPSFQRAAEYAWPLTSITGLIGKPYFCANAKSRASCAGTPITAPSPTRINT